MIGPIPATYGEAANATEEAALIAQGCTIIVRTDLLPPQPVPSVPKVVLELSLASAFTDSSPTPKTVNNNGAAISNGSADFNGGYISVADHADLSFGTGDFEISFDFQMSTLLNGAHQFLMSKGVAGSINSAWYICYESINNSELGHLWLTTTNNNVAINAVSGIADTTQMHNLKVKRVAGVITMYLDGVSVGSTTATVIDTSAPLLVGAWNYTPASHRFLGRMKNLKIIKG